MQLVLAIPIMLQLSDDLYVQVDIIHFPKFIRT